MPILTRDQILAVVDLKTEEVQVPEWGGSVLVRSLTGRERDLFEQSIVVQDGKKRQMNIDNIRAKLVSLSVVDEEGKRVFTEKDATKLGEKNAAALDRVFSVAQRLSSLSDEDIEDLAQNLESGQ